MKDIFRPSNDPAQLIYDAFQKEGKKRDRCSCVEWIENERLVVFKTAKLYAESNGMIVPTMDQIKMAERGAHGSVDYGSKWAYKVANIMRGEKNG